MRLLRMLSGLLAGLWVRRTVRMSSEVQELRNENRDMQQRLDDLRGTNLRLIRERLELRRQLADRPEHVDHAAGRDLRARDTLDDVRGLLRSQFGWSVKRSAVPHAVAEISCELAALKKRLGEEALREEGLLHSPGTPGSDEATYGFQNECGRSLRDRATIRLDRLLDGLES